MSFYRGLLKSEKVIHQIQKHGFKSSVVCRGEPGALTPRQKVMANQASMDHMLVPSGSWQENYNAKQPMYNLNLLLSTIAMLAASYAFLSRKLVYTPDYSKPINLKEIYDKQR